MLTLMAPHRQGIGLTIGACLVLIGSLAASGNGSPFDVNDIVSRSVANNDANWKAAPLYGFKEHDVIAKGGKTTSLTYEVTMIDGSPYDRTIAVDGKPLTAAELKEEFDKERRESERRRAETPAARRKRIEVYERGRRQDHDLMREMIDAFRFKLIGKEMMDGHECFRVEATPRPGYVPQSRDTKVLTGMRGTLWIDSAEYQWVKVTASVFRPVAFGLFIAHVEPGTEFTLEQTPVNGKLWLPSHFRNQVKATILLFWGRNSIDDKTYTDYHPIR